MPKLIVSIFLRIVFLIFVHICLRELYERALFSTERWKTFCVFI